MKKLIPLFVVLAAGIASAEWKLNPYTQRQDYYESKAAVVLSTGTLQVEIDALHVATTTLTQNLATEVSDRTIADAAIAVSTGTLTTGLASEASARQAADLVIGLTTASLRSDLTTEANNRIAGDSAVGASTGTLGVRVTAAEAALSTAAYTTASYANPAWITSLASSKIDFSTITTALAGKLTAPATFYIVKPTEFLQAPATFYIAKASDYLVSPASFSYVSTESDPVFSLAEPRIDARGVRNIISLPTLTTQFAATTPSPTMF